MFPYIQLKLTDKMVDDLRREHQQAIEGRGQSVALLSDDLEDHDKQIQTMRMLDWKYENVGLQSEIEAKDQQIAALQRYFVVYLANKDKTNGIAIIRRNDEAAEYPYISICGHNDCRNNNTCFFVTRVAPLCR